MSSFRIPKKPRTDAAGSSSGGPSSSSQPPRISLPSGGPSTGKTFKEAGSTKVQTNMFRVDISRMPTRMVRLCMDTHLCGGKVKIKLSDGLTSVSGGLNTTDKRLALRVIFRKIVSRHPEIFGTDLLKYTFDCATTIYAVDGAFKGGNDKLEETLRKEDFKDEEWSQISRIIRRQATYFKVAISANGYVYTRGSDFEAVKNRQELTRLIEIASSEVLNTPDFLQYGSQTFPLKTRVTNKPDETSEIRMGFDKGVRLLDKGDIAMSIDNKQSPFYSATSVLKFVTSKYGEHVGIPGAAPQRRGDQRGREDPRGQRNRSRSRSPRREHQETPLDYDIGQVNHFMNAFTSKRDPAVFRAIEEAIKGIFAEPIHLPKTHNHNIVITGFAKTNAKNTYFKLNEGQENEATINVEDYFFQHRERRLQFPLLPLIETGKGNRKTYFPMELLKIVPGQRIKAQKMSTVVQSSMTGNKATLPREHIQRIREVMTNSLRLDNNPHLKSFGINVNREPIKLDAQMIHPAEVLFKNRAVCPMKSGSVQFAPLKNTQFWKPATIGMVAVVDFDNMQLDLTSFCKNLHEKCSINGLKMTTQPTSWRHFNLHSNDTENLKSEMSNLKKQNVTIIIGITKEKKPAVHDVLKYFEATLGLQTLQIHVNTATHFIKNTGTQTVENVIRKLNPKCGGVNFVVEPPQSVKRQPVCSNITDVKRRLFGKTQFIGFEMTHGSARTLFDRSQGTFDGEPTIVGCAYSLELATDLGGFNYLQEMNEYKLKNLEEKFGKCLKHYETAVGHLPETVVVFRTGAGEGDFKRVQDEIADMKKALEGRKIQLVVLVVQKTSHTRIFPENIEGTSALSQNVKSGTVVDGGITSFGRQEFILVSQTGQIGTVKPIKYTVAANDPGWTKNELCHLTYFLAFGHQVSYQPPAVPHILYAAENLAKRGRNNFLTHKKLDKVGESIKKVLREHGDLNDGDHQKELESFMVDDISKVMNAMALERKNFWA